MTFTSPLLVTIHPIEDGLYRWILRLDPFTQSTSCTLIQ